MEPPGFGHGATPVAPTRSQKKPRRLPGGLGLSFQAPASKGVLRKDGVLHGSGGLGEGGGCGGKGVGRVGWVALGWGGGDVVWGWCGVEVDRFSGALRKLLATNRSGRFGRCKDRPAMME